MWRNYLRGKRFPLIIDDSGMRYLFDQPNPNARQAIWLELICEFYFDIVYVKGKENRVADVLSRRVHDVYVAAVSTGKLDLKDTILEALNSDEFYLQTKEKLQEADAHEKYKYYQLVEDGILKLKS